MNKTLVAEYEGAAISGIELQQAADDALAEVLSDQACRSELRQQGLDDNSLDGVRFLVEQEPGFEPISATILILIAASGQLTADGSKGLWGMVSRRIKRRKGHDALGDEHQTAD